MRFKKCKQTATGKHLWNEFYKGFETKFYIRDGHSNMIMVPTGTFKKCEACGFVDDTNEK